MWNIPRSRIVLSNPARSCENRTNTNFDYKQQLVLAIMKTFTVVLVASMPLIAPASRDLKQAANPPSKSSEPQVPPASARKGPKESQKGLSGILLSLRPQLL